MQNTAQQSDNGRGETFANTVAVIFTIFALANKVSQFKILI